MSSVIFSRFFAKKVDDNGSRAQMKKWVERIKEEKKIGDLCDKRRRPPAFLTYCDQKNKIMRNKTNNDKWSRPPDFLTKIKSEKQWSCKRYTCHIVFGWSLPPNPKTTNRCNHFSSLLLLFKNVSISVKYHIYSSKILKILSKLRQKCWLNVKNFCWVLNLQPQTNAI